MDSYGSPKLVFTIYAFVLKFTEIVSCLSRILFNSI